MVRCAPVSMRRALRLIAPASSIWRRGLALPRAHLLALGRRPFGVPAPGLAPLARLLEQVPWGRPVPLPLFIFVQRRPAQQLNIAACMPAAAEKALVRACGSEGSPGSVRAEPSAPVIRLASTAPGAPVCRAIPPVPGRHPVPPVPVPVFLPVPFSFPVSGPLPFPLPFSFLLPLLLCFPLALLAALLLLVSVLLSVLALVLLLVLLLLVLLLVLRPASKGDALVHASAHDSMQPGSQQEAHV